MSKVFVIGFQKTGTISMYGALTSLGYTVCKKQVLWKTDSNLTKEDLRKLSLEAAQHSDAFVNNPWPLFFRELSE